MSGFIGELQRRNVIRMAGVPALRRGAILCARFDVHHRRDESRPYILFRNLLKRMGLTE